MEFMGKQFIYSVLFIINCKHFGNTKITRFNCVTVVKTSMILFVPINLYSYL